MFVDLTPEQRALQAELRQYFSSLISPEEAKEMETDRHGKAYRAVIRRMGRTASSASAGPRSSAATGSGRSNSRSSLTRRPAPTLPAVTLGRRTALQVRQRGAEEEVPAGHPGRRGALRDRLLRAGCGDRPGVAAHLRRPPGRRVHRQRPEDLHHRRTMPTTSGWRAAPIRKR